MDFDANWLQAIAAIVQTVLALAVWTVTRRQADIADRQANIAHLQSEAQSIEALREVIAKHHSLEAKKYRELGRVTIYNWVLSKKIDAQVPEKLAAGVAAAKADPKFQEYKSAYDDIANYYEYLGMLSSISSTYRAFILRMVHNSSTDIWNKLYDPERAAIARKISRGEETIAADWAGDFQYLVREAKKFRESGGLNG